RLAQLAQAMFGIADFADRGPAIRRNLAHFTGTQAKRGVALLACNQLTRSAGAARDLRTLAGLHLDAMHERTDRHVAQRQRVAHLDRHVGAREQLIADLDALRCDDVAALT